MKVNNTDHIVKIPSVQPQGRCYSAIEIEVEFYGSGLEPDINLRQDNYPIYLESPTLKSLIEALQKAQQIIEESQGTLRETPKEKKS